MHERDDWEADDWEAAFSATEPDEDTSGYDDYDYEPIASPDYPDQYLRGWNEPTRPQPQPLGWQGTMTTILLFLFMLGGLILAIVTIAPIWAAYGAPATSPTPWPSGPRFSRCAPWAGSYTASYPASTGSLKLIALKADPRAQIRKAADQGNAGAQYSLGVMYSNGRGVLQDDREAAAWFQKATDQGHASAQWEIGRVHQRQAHYSQALNWFLKAADQRHPGAQYSIGVLYSKGHGVPQNDREAAAWFRIAADQGHAEAQYALSRCYEQGRGVKQNPVHAYAWMSLAGNASPGRHAHALVSLENSMNQAELIDAQRLAADYRQHGSRTRLIRTRELVQRAKDSQKTGAAS